MDEMADERRVGLLRREDIVNQLVHVASIKGITPDELSESGMVDWLWLAGDALGLNRQGRQLEASVIAELRRRDRALARAEEGS